MNYLKHYKLLVMRAKHRILNGYGEWHHIKPRCIGGSNNKANLVHLTPEEHHLAHLLLVKIYPSNMKLVYAAKLMQTRNNKKYGWLRRKHSVIVSENMMGNKHAKDHKLTNRHKIAISKAHIGNQHGRGRKRSEKWIKEMRIRMKGNKYAKPLKGDSNPGIIYRGRTWVKDPLTGKRIWQ